MGRRNIDESTTSESKSTTSESTYEEVSPDPYGREAKHYSEIRVLSRDVSSGFIAMHYFLPPYINFSCFLRSTNKVIYRSGLS